MYQYLFINLPSTISKISNRYLSRPVIMLVGVWWLNTNKTANQAFYLWQLGLVGRLLTPMTLLDLLILFLCCRKQGHKTHVISMSNWKSIWSCQLFKQGLTIPLCCILWSNPWLCLSSWCTYTYHVNMRPWSKIWRLACQWIVTWNDSWLYYNYSNYWQRAMTPGNTYRMIRFSLISFITNHIKLSQVFLLLMMKSSNRQAGTILHWYFHFQWWWVLDNEAPQNLMRTRDQTPWLIVHSPS